MTAQIIPFPTPRITAWDKLIAVEKQREGFCERVHKDSYGKPVYCFERQRVIRVPVYSTEGEVS